MTLNGFDRIAFIYDFLARLVYGRDIVDSQECFLERVNDHSKILMVGGGSGWLLVSLLRKKPNCKIWYIEASEQMIGLAKKKVEAGQTVNFIHGTEQNIQPSPTYDAVITNFYLDLFADEQLHQVVGKIRGSMKPGSLWLATDFVRGQPWWQKAMLNTMYFFFRITCGLESHRLPEWNKSLTEAGAREIDSRFFYKGFIKAALYQF